MITPLESPRASLALLARHVGFDAVESGCSIRFVMRGRRPVATVAPGVVVVAATPDGEVMGSPARRRPNCRSR